MNKSVTAYDLTLEKVAKSDRPILDALLQSYLKEFSHFSPQKKDSSGHFFYPYFKYYWQDPDRHPFFIMNGTQICGFILIRAERDPETTENTVELAEFFITEPFRRQGCGQRAAQLVWDLFPYQWKVSIMKENKSALPFWAKTITDYTQNQYELIELGQKKLIIYTFLSRSSSPFSHLSRI